MQQLVQFWTLHVPGYPGDRPVVHGVVSHLGQIGFVDAHIAQASRDREPGQEALDRRDGPFVGGPRRPLIGYLRASASIGAEVEVIDAGRIDEAYDRVVAGDVRFRTEAMYASAADDELHFQQFLSANCFGDYYTRGGIDVRTRELLTFAMLAALGGCDPQVKGHVAANLNVGNGRQLLISVTTALLPFIGYPRTLNALAAINEIAPAAHEGH
jgi:alkylhydroperoxidase/carboxymuconolactone decarboxylase family protein YurZ